MRCVPALSMRHDFSAALGAWRDVRLAALQDELRALNPGVVEGQREALISRKALADRTREFKRQAPDAQLEGIRALLKAYQGEVDALTSRAKQAESVLLDINTRLDTAPDPYPVFESLVVRRYANRLTTGTHGIRERRGSAAEAA